MIKAGNLSFRMMLQKPSKQVDGYNELLANAGDAWEDEQEFNLSLRPLRAGERYRANRIQHETTHELGSWYSPMITPAKRFTYYDTAREAYRYFYIDAIRDPDESLRELLITAVEIWQTT